VYTHPSSNSNMGQGRYNCSIPRLHQLYEALCRHSCEFKFDVTFVSRNYQKCNDCEKLLHSFRRGLMSPETMDTFGCLGPPIYLLREIFGSRYDTFWFLDPECGSQKATVLVLVVVVISSQKIPKAFLICSGAQQNCVHIRADIAHISAISDFPLVF